MNADDQVFSKKPCRACTDFKQWTKSFEQNENSKKKTNDQNSDKDSSQISPTTNQPTKQCPLDSQKLGRYSWSVLHTIAAYYPDTPTDDQKNEMTQFITLFTKFYPCQDCSEDFKERLDVSPPITESSSKLSQWLCMMHNQVNKKLGKPEFDCKLVDQRWKTGWDDGFCD